MILRKADDALVPKTRVEIAAGAAFIAARRINLPMFQPPLILVPDLGASHLGQGSMPRMVTFFPARAESAKVAAPTEM